MAKRLSGWRRSVASNTNGNHRPNAPPVEHDGEERGQGGEPQASNGRGADNVETGALFWTSSTTN